MEHDKSSTVVAGVDVGKSRLDAAIGESAHSLAVGNDPDGIGTLLDWLGAHGVSRVGMEATGGLERDLRLRLEAEGFKVVLHQPTEVKLFGRFSRQRAKTDPADARLIAAATAAINRRTRPADPELIALGERLTTYEQIADQLMELRTFRQSLRLSDLIGLIDGQIQALKALKQSLARALVSAIKACEALRHRYELLTSLPGIGPMVAISLIIRMPELGEMQRGQAASLLGVAPHARESGQWKGQRFIAGGRSRPRRMLYLAALAARSQDRTLRTFADRLTTRGKPAKLAIVAVMRKLIEAANLVLKRQRPWAP